MSKFRFVALWLFLIISFISIGAILVFSALGYDLNRQNFKFYKTGLIYMKIQPSDSQVFLDGKRVRLSKRNSLPKLLPGHYELEVKKAGYQTWSANVEIRGGLATIYENVNLFLKEPVIQTANQSEAEKLSRLEELTDLKIVDQSEIRIIQDDEDRLATRFSFPIKKARWHPDKEHISFIAQGELRIIELDGANNQLLVKIGDAERADYYFQNEKTVIFQNTQGVQKAIIQ